MLLTGDSPLNQRHVQTKNQGMEKGISCKQQGEKAGVAVLVSDKIDFKTKEVTR